MWYKTLQLFRSINSPTDFFEFQEHLISKIIHAESMSKKRARYIKEVKQKKFKVGRETNKNIDRIKRHDEVITELETSRRNYEYTLEICKFFGDSLAFLIYPKHEIKVLCKNHDPGHISGKQGFELELSVVRSAAQDGMVAILHDITNCLTIGDVTIVHPDQGYIIAECKTTTTDEIKITDRVIRQMERMDHAIESINNDTTFRYDKKTLKGMDEYGMPNGFIEISTKEKLLLQEFIDVCILEDKPYKMITPEEGLIYVAIKDEFYEEYFNDIKDKIMDKPRIVGNILRRVNGDYPYIPPFILFDLPNELVIKLLNVELIFFVFIDTEFVVSELERNGYKAHPVLDERNDFVGLTIEQTIGKTEKPFIGPKLLQEVFYQFMSLRSAINSTIELLQNVEKIDPNEFIASQEEPNIT